MDIIYRCKLKHLEFTIAAGDIFDAPVDAIVNSEQTDFILSKNPKSLSGQIWYRYGDLVQDELDAATDRRILGPGMVVETSGGKRIFHAGFHYPDDWIDDSDPDSKQTEYFAAIGSCTRQIIRTAVDRKLESIAFPLIGCGIFGLSERMLVLQLLNVLEELDDHFEGERFNVWLVIRNPSQFQEVIVTLLNLLVQTRRGTASVKLEQTGVPILDRFAERLIVRANEDWVKWQLCRYTEIAIEFMCYGLCRAINPPVLPDKLLDEARPLSFGLVLNKAKKFAESTGLECNDRWGANFFCTVLRDEMSASALDHLNHQRNNLAHGRKSLPLPEIKTLVSKGLRLDSWREVPHADGELQLAEWSPWVKILPTNGGQIGLFERWQKNKVRYLVPETGEVFAEQMNN